MYNGTMIEELMAAVERAEEHAHTDAPLWLRRSVWDEVGASTHVYESATPIEFSVRA